MRNLTDIHHQLSATDRVYLEKQAEQYKIAEEEDAAGRIMARGFADELQKLASPYLPGQNPPGGGFGNQRSGGGGGEKPNVIPMKNQSVDTGALRRKGERGAAAFGMGMAPGTSATRAGAAPQVNGAPRPPRPPGNLAQR